MYKLVNDPITNEVRCIFREDNTSIPLNPANTDYQKYLEWLAEGNEPLPADEV